MSLISIEKQYDEYAEEYSNNLDNSMQLQNLNRLFNYLTLINPNISNKDWLDAGCGPGSLFKLRKQFFPKKLVGIDLSENMIQIAKKTQFYNFCEVGNLVNLSEIQNESFDIYFSNTVFHWLNLAGKGCFKRALEEAYRVLKPQGVIALSLSGIGTAKQMIDVYKEIITKFQGINSSLIDCNGVHDDVLGSENLFKTVDLLEETGFFVELARLEFEPVIFNHPSDYVRAVEKYGKHIYLMPFKNLEKKQQDEIFGQIGKNFVNRTGHKEYRHKQYIIYIIGRKLNKL